MANPARTAALASVCAAITTVATVLLLQHLTGSPAPGPQAPPLTAPPQIVAEAAPPEVTLPPTLPTPAPVMDLASFGALPQTLAPASPPPPATLVATPGAMAFAATSLQSLADTFTQSPLESALPSFGAGSSALDGPADAALDVPVIEAESPPVNSPTGKVIAFDASEGTKLDPLHNRAWDLNAVQVVPPLTLR